MTKTKNVGRLQLRRESAHLEIRLMIRPNRSLTFAALKGIFSCKRANKAIRVSGHQGAGYLDIRLSGRFAFTDTPVFWYPAI